MTFSLFDFLFGEGSSKTSPDTAKGLKEHRLLKPSLHLANENNQTLTSNIAYRLERAKRKSVGFIVDGRGLTVRAPRWVSREDIETMIHKREAWIRQKLAQFADWQVKVQSAQAELKDGAQLPYLGASVRIRLEPSASCVELVGSELLVNLPLDAESSHIKGWVQMWFKNEAKRLLGDRLEQIASETGLSFSSWKLSSAQCRWGCCTSARTIRLNRKLIHLDWELIDYVIIHELAHLCEMNHSPKFWAKVASLCPDYEARRRRLKAIYIPQLPF